MNLKQQLAYIIKFKMGDEIKQFYVFSLKFFTTYKNNIYFDYDFIIVFSLYNNTSGKHRISVTI